MQTIIGTIRTTTVITKYMYMQEVGVNKNYDGKDKLDADNL